MSPVPTPTAPPAAPTGAAALPGAATPGGRARPAVLPAGRLHLLLCLFLVLIYVGTMVSVEQAGGATRGCPDGRDRCAAAGNQDGR